MFHVQRMAVRRLQWVGSALLVMVALILPAAGQPVTAHPTLLAPASPTAAPMDSTFVPGVLLVRRRPGVAANTVRQVEPQARFSQAVGRAGIEKWQVPVGGEWALANRLRGAGVADIAELDYIRHTTNFPDDPLYPDQWAFPKINAPRAWNMTLGKSSVVVAVIDTGFDFDHPDQPLHLIPGPTHTSTATQDGCGPEGVNGPEDDFGHGTHVGGIIAAATNNSVGVAGLASGVQLLVIKAGDCVGSLADSDVAQSIDDATLAGAQVISMSFGGTESSTVIDQAIQTAWNAGVVLVAAAGNEGRAESFYPAASPHVMGITATDAGDNVASFSNQGTYVALAAPGVSILSTVPNDTPIKGGILVYYTYLSGTSMATPYVAAAAALLFSGSCSQTNSTVVSILEQTAVPLGSIIPNPVSGYGRLDIGAALEATRASSVQGTVPPPPGLAPRYVFPLIPFNSC